MNTKTKIGLLALLGTISGSANAALMFGGYTFDDNAFADEVVSYLPGPDVGAGYNVGTGALGTPDWSASNDNNTAASLGESGSLVVKFTDNSLTTSGDNTGDLYIFEIGNAIEYFNVKISTNSIDWIDLGDVLGQPAVIDIDAVAGVVLWEQYSYVMLTDVSPNQSGSPYGEADIDAIGAISSAPPADGQIPVPAPIALLGLGLAAISSTRKRKA